MILRIFRILGTAEITYRQIHPRGIVLPLVGPPVQIAVPFIGRMGKPKHILHHPIRQRIPFPGLQIRIIPVISHAGQYKARDGLGLHRRQISAQIGNGADGLRDDHDSIGKISVEGLQPFCQPYRQHRAGYFIICHRGMTDISRK